MCLFIMITFEGVSTRTRLSPFLEKSEILSYKVKVHHNKTYNLIYILLAKRLAYYGFIVLKLNTLQNISKA